jgi:hypothetical protein
LRDVEALVDANGAALWTATRGEVPTLVLSGDGDPGPAWPGRELAEPLRGQLRGFLA